MKMVEAARRMNRTLLEMHIGMAFWGLVCQIAGALVMALCGYGVFQGRYALSLWFGVAFAFAGSIHMCRTLDRALLSGGNAGGIVTRGYLFRYFLLAAVLVIVTLTDTMDPLVFFLGYMGLKVTAYLQPITHKLCNRLFREEDPIPLSEEELAAQEGERKCKIYKEREVRVWDMEFCCLAGQRSISISMGCFSIPFSGIPFGSPHRTYAS